MNIIELQIKRANKNNFPNSLDSEFFPSKLYSYGKSSNKGNSNKEDGFSLENGLENNKTELTFSTGCLLHETRRSQQKGEDQNIEHSAR